MGVAGRRNDLFIYLGSSANRGDRVGLRLQNLHSSGKAGQIMRHFSLTSDVRPFPMDVHYGTLFTDYRPLLAVLRVTGFSVWPLHNKLNLE